MESNEKKEIPNWILELSKDDAHAIVDMVRMYQTGKRAMIKAIVTAIIGAIVTGVATGLIHWVRTFSVVVGILSFWIFGRFTSSI